MDYTSLFKSSGRKESKVGIISITRGYGYTLLARIPKAELMELRLISSRHMDECVEVLTGLGYRKEDAIIYGNKEQVRSTPGHGVFIVNDYRLVPENDITALVECAGNTAMSLEMSADALRKGIDVYMVSKKTDNVCGPILNNITKKHGTVYSLADGDQPRNPLNLYSWGKVLGLEIIITDKTSEYDFVWDPDTDEFTYMEDPEKPYESVPGLKEFWHYGDPGTLKGCRRLLERYITVISAGPYEMNPVSNVTGLIPSDRRLNYPVVKTSELVDISVPEEDGGILEKTGVVGAFCNLRASDRVSFAGDEFIIIRCENETVWELLAGKGHVVSRNGKYACIYPPYHYMGLETSISILLRDILGLGTCPECRQISVMAGVAQEDMSKGTVPKVQGHHHSIGGLAPELQELRDAGNVAPLYLLNGTTLLEDVKVGQPITKNVMGLSGGLLYELYSEGLGLWLQYGL